ncbi:hypothetical protein BDF19DRAFT_468226 [Syncephalis fuscata]|nr:hypothetical protein BDF19DRAFT_468226 [Syncephalis fuscata]
MPVFNYSNPEELEWQNNATKVWGIPLHPYGEMNLLDFEVQSFESGNRKYDQFSGIRFQIAFVMGALPVIALNVYISAKMVLNRPHLLASWCCFIPSATGVITITTFILVYLGFCFNCRYLIWSIGFGMSVTYFCNSLILLQKAYLILYRKKWVLYTCIPLILPQLSFAFMVIFGCFATLDVPNGCAIHYPPFFIWVWTVTIIPLNVLLSAVFCRTALQQYRALGSEAWKRLAHDGIQIMFLAALFNIICCICIPLQIGGSNADLFFTGDWVVVSTLLNNHCKRIKMATKLSNRPKTTHIPGHSQLDTEYSTYHTL